MTSGQLHCGVTSKEYRLIRRMCAGDPLEGEMLAVCEATHDQSMGTQPHRISISRYLGSADADRRLGGQILSDLMSGKTRYFTNAIGDPLARVSVWRSNAPGSCIMMIKGLQSAIANSCNLMNIVSAMENQVRTFSAATKQGLAASPDLVPQPDAHFR